jgi:hypothetical protein
VGGAGCAPAGLGEVLSVPPQWVTNHLILQQNEQIVTSCPARSRARSTDCSIACGVRGLFVFVSRLYSYQDSLDMVWGHCGVEMKAMGPTCKMSLQLEMSL